MPTNKFKIVVTDGEVNVEKLKEIGKVVQYEKEGVIPKEILYEWSKDADALFCLLRDRIDKDFIDNCPKLKVIATMSVGYEHIDIEECKKRKIKVGYTPGVLTEATAELCVSLVLATSRRLFEANQAAKDGKWKTWEPYFLCGKQLNGSVVGFYGLGQVGLSVAKKLEGFNPKSIIYNNRSKRNDVSYNYVDFETLLSESDFLIVTASVNAENKQIFNQSAFTKMKKDAIFCNVGRGALVKTDDLYTALNEEQIHAAGIDVMDPEPLSPQNKLFQLPNCVILPHIGSATYQTRNLMVSMTVDNIYNALSGEKMKAAVIE